MSTARKKILVYLVLVFGFSSIFYALISQAGTVGNYSFGLMWSPAVAAIITQLVFQHNLRAMGWQRAKARYILAAIGLPLLYCLVVYGITWLTGLGKVSLDGAINFAAPFVKGKITSPAMFVLIYIGVMLTLGTVQSLFTAFGEELGWRGLLVPELSKETSFTTATLISGVIWVAYHVPIILTANYHNAGAPVWFGLVCFSIGVMGLSFAFNWLRLKSGSIWPAVCLHAFHNLFIQGIFTPFTAQTGLTAYVIDEFGVGMLLIGLAVGFYFWRRRGELPGPPQGT
jgi:uncharacterized protein